MKKAFLFVLPFVLIFGIVCFWLDSLKFKPAYNPGDCYRNATDNFGLAQISSVDRLTFGTYIEYVFVDSLSLNTEPFHRKEVSDFVNLYTEKIDCSLFERGRDRALAYRNNNDLNSRIDSLEHRVELLERKKK